MKSNIEYKLITVNDKIKYVDVTQMYGTAEFGICTKFVRGRLTDIYLTRMQQPDEKEKGYHIDLKEAFPNWRINCFLICAWSHKTADPRIWRQWWCKEHKAICHQTYVPRNTDTIKFDLYGGRKDGSIDIRFVKDESVGE